jgi:membrane-associated phospholipid phosphatase
MKSGRRWGEDATLRPGLDRISHSALHAAIHPATWLPALGAAIFAIDDFDRKVSDWAGEEKPVFGSQSSARDASNILLGAMGGITAATIVATPSGKEAKPWLESKGKGLLIEGCAIGSALGMTATLKAAAGRTRPDQSDQRSFPSGHATAGFSLAALTSGNLDSIALPRGVRTGLKAASYAMGVTVGWARVESLSHFPSDVLAGAAIGHFLTVFIHDAFLGSSDETQSLQLEVLPSTGGGIVFAHLAF